MTRKRQASTQKRGENKTNIDDCSSWPTARGRRTGNFLAAPQAGPAGSGGGGGGGSASGEIAQTRYKLCRHATGACGGQQIELICATRGPQQFIAARELRELAHQNEIGCRTKPRAPQRALSRLGPFRRGAGSEGGRAPAAVCRARLSKRRTGAAPLLMARSVARRWPPRGAVKKPMGARSSRPVDLPTSAQFSASGAEGSEVQLVDRKNSGQVYRLKHRVSRSARLRGPLRRRPQLMRNSFR